MFIGQSGKNQASLIINGYQHPGNRKNYYDANWLDLTLTLKTPQYQWSAQAPAMLACEMYRFIDWLQAIHERQAVNRFFDCQEPLIYFSLDQQNEDGYILTFHLGLDFKPPHVEQSAFTLEISNEQLLQWISHLQSYAIKCPVNYIIGSQA